jgi:hypothetical protein
VSLRWLSEQRGQPCARAGPHWSPRGWGGRFMRMRWWSGRNGCIRNTCFAALTQPLLRKRGMCHDTPNAPGTRPARVHARTHAHVQDMEQDEDYEFDYEDSDQVRLGRADVLFSCSVSCCCSLLTRWLGERGGGKEGEKGKAQTRRICFSPVASHAAAHLFRRSYAVLRLPSLSMFFPFVLEGPRWAGGHRELYHGQVDIEN